MRELKFKVWDTVKLKMLEPQGITFESKTLIPFAVKVSGCGWAPVGKYEIIQWTGLSDENGTNVFEGDYVRISSVLFKVVWNEKLSGFELIQLGDSLKRSIADVINGYVAGNEFENTNLAW